MSSLTAAARTFEDVFQPNLTVPRANLDRLAAIAALFGFRSEPIDRCRVLELGCSQGNNLFAMADLHPDSSFVGVDDSGERIAAARHVAEVVGFKNVEFRQLNIATVDEQLGTFDYIYCHDLFGRASAAVQDRLLAICRSLLKPRGVAYLSYRTLPGGLMSGVLQELVRGPAGETSNVQAGVERARKLLEFLSGSLVEDDSAYGQLLKAEADLALAMPDRLLAYEHLASDSRQIFFHEFVERATRHELQYLGDTEIGMMSAVALRPSAARNLEQVAHDSVSLEQHLDLLRNRGYHRSLLCHQEASFDRGVSPARLQGLFLAGNLRRESRPPDAQNLAPSGAQPPAQFIAANGATISSPSPLVSAAFSELGAAWPRGILFEELVKTARRTLGSDDQPASLAEQTEELAQSLVACIGAGLVEPRTVADAFVTAVSDRPRASRWTRAVAASNAPLTNRLQERVPLDEMSRNLLGYLDGERDRAALLETLIQATEQGQLSILKSGMPASQGDTAAEILEQVLDQSLAKLAASALLVA